MYGINRDYDALKIVVELAEESVLTEEMADTDFLKQEREKQLEAVRYIKEEGLLEFLKSQD